MSYDTDKVQAGRQRIDVVNIVQRSCSLVFGVGACTATGEECFNTWESCKIPTAFSATTKNITLCTGWSDCPAGYIPLLKPGSATKPGSVTFDPGDITPEDGIGKVGTISVQAMDAPHDDVGLDPYVASRSYRALDRGTLWPRLRARWPNWQGITLEWYSGYVHSPFSLSNLKKRVYLIEKIDGFGRSEGVKITAKDPIKLADDARAVWPVKSTGVLAEAITDVSSPTTLDITTADTSEYAIDVYETDGSAVNISGEIFRYNSYTIITGGVRLTGVQRGAPTPYVTPAAEHDIGDEVQKCAWFYNMRAPDCIRRLLTLGAGIDASYIDYAAWQTLFDTWLAGQRLRRLVAEPTGVNKLISECMQQSGGWGLWWDDVALEVRYDVIRPAGLEETVVTITDDANIAGDTIVISDDPDKLINDAVFYYGEISPVENSDKASNYRNAVRSIDLDSISDNEVGDTRLKTIYGRWHAVQNRGEITELTDRLVQWRGTIALKFEFQLDRKDDSLQTGDFVDIRTSALRDIYGEPRTVRARVTQVNNAGERIKYIAREDFASSRYALWAPDSIALGTTWATATEEQRLKYMFWADANGIYSNGSTGKRWY